LLVLYHSDPLARMEAPSKCLLMAYLIVMNFDRHRWAPLAYGAAAGAIAAFLFGTLQLSEIDRVTGDSNAVRFGMMALVLASISAVAFVHAGKDRIMAAVSFAGFACGVASAFISGSRSAVLALPVIFLCFVPALRRLSPRAALSLVAFLSGFVGLLLVANVGNVSTRLAVAYADLAAIASGGELGAGHAVGDMAGEAASRSDSERMKLLGLAWRLFRENPLLGAGSNGWDAAVLALVAAPNPEERLPTPYNQAHNQYADDLAKGGLVGLFLTLSVLFVPLFLFLRLRPFGDGDASHLALAGTVVSLSFIIFSVAESLLLLSLPSILHTVLTLYLLCSCDEAAGKTRRQVGDAPDPALK
jgi:O-antigen ligase